MNLPDDDGLTAEEQDRFAALARERVPAVAVEERIVQALRREGALRAPWYRRTVSVPIAAAAGFVLFALGAAAGRGVPSSRRGVALPAPSADARVLESPPAGRLVTWM